MANKEVILYHGSNVVVEKQAKKRALTKRGKNIVSIYSYQPTEDMKVLSFPEMTDEWLDFVVDCRRGIKHDYDIVEGPMADDQIWYYVEDFMEGTITREAFWILAKFKYPTHQIVFCTQKALETIVFERSISL